MNDIREKWRSDGFGEETKTLLFANSSICLNEFKDTAGYNTPGMVQGSMDRVSRNNSISYIHEKHLTNRTDLYLIIDSPELEFDEATDEYIERVQYFSSKEHGIILQVDMSDIESEYRRVLAIYVPYVSDKVNRINTVCKLYLTKSDTEWNLSNVRSPFNEIIDNHNKNSNWRDFRSKK